MLVCPHLHLTFHPEAHPSTTGAIVLLGEDDLVDAGSAIGGQVGQMVQQASYVRGSTPGLFVRGQRATVLDWETVRQIGDPAAAAAAAIELAAAMPDTTGWVLIEIPSEERSWSVIPAAIESVGWTHDPRRGLLRLRWRLLAGVAEEIIETPP